jgi:hypothetical protein
MNRTGQTGTDYFQSIKLQEVPANIWSFDTV